MGAVARNAAQNPTTGQVRAAKHDALLDKARAYVDRVESGLDPARALRELGAASVEWRQAEIAAMTYRGPREP